MRRVNCSILDYVTIFEKLALIFHQLSSGTQFAKVSHKNAIAENRCEKQWTLRFVYQHEIIYSGWSLDWLLSIKQFFTNV